jgi:hypothetical protein
VRLQGGISTGSTLTDICDVAAKVPENAPRRDVAVQRDDAAGTGGLHRQFVRDQRPMDSRPVLPPEFAVPHQCEIRGELYGFRASRCPREGGTFRSVPGPEIYANYTATNRRPSSHRSERVLSGGVATLPV